MRLTMRRRRRASVRRRSSSDMDSLYITDLQRDYHLVDMCCCDSISSSLYFFGL